MRCIEMSSKHRIIASPPVGSRPRSWSEVPPDIVAIELPLLIEAADCASAVVALINGNHLSTGQLAALGRLNFQAYLKSFDPPVALLTDRTIVSPEFATAYSIVENSK